MEAATEFTLLAQDWRDLEALKGDYEAYGFCLADGVYEEPQLAEIEQFFEDYKRNGGHFAATGDVYNEEIKTKEQVRAMHPHRFDECAKAWLLEPRCATVLEALLGKPALGAQTMYYYKPPGAKGQGMHQDNFYLLAAPAACIAAWSPIDDADLDNGCLYLVPGSYESGVICPESKTERWLDYGDSHISKFPREQKPVPVPVKRGQTLFFHGYTIHGSGPNRTTDRYRRTFIGHYISEASEQVARFYHPLLNMQGEVVSDVAVHPGGGPCGDDWRGAAH